MNANILTKVKTHIKKKQGFFQEQKNIYLIVALLLLIPAAGIVMANEPNANNFEALDNIKSAAEKFAIEQINTEGLSNITASSSALDSRLHLKKCDVPLQAFSNSASSNIGRLTIGVRCTGIKPWSLYVPVTINAMANAVTTSRPLVRGEVLSPSDLQVVSRSVKQLPANYLRNLEELAGMEVTRPIQSGLILTLNMIKATPLIQKGQEVIISASSGSIKVRMNGIALKNGAPGEFIPIRNTNSGRTVEGQVLNANTVTVKL